MAGVHFLVSSSALTCAIFASQAPVQQIPDLASHMFQILAVKKKADV